MTRCPHCGRLVLPWQKATRRAGLYVHRDCAAEFPAPAHSSKGSIRTTHRPPPVPGTLRARVAKYTALPAMPATLLVGALAFVLLGVMLLAVVAAGRATWAPDMFAWWASEHGWIVQGYAMATFLAAAQAALGGVVVGLIVRRRFPLQPKTPLVIGLNLAVSLGAALAVVGFILF